MRRRAWRSGLLAISLGLMAARGAGGAGQERLALDVAFPLPGHEVRLPVPFVEVRGRTGTAELFAGDVVIALDLSAGALRASGLDVDRDGIVGETRPFAEHESKRSGRLRAHAFTSDVDDTVGEAQLAAMEPLITALALRQNRVGLLTFTQDPRVRAPVGAPAFTLAAARAIRLRENREGPNLHRALRTASRLLQEAPQPADRLGDARPRAILLFSDGRASHPSKGRGKRKALEIARTLAGENVALYVFALGDDGDRDFAVLLAQEADGRLVPLDNPAGLLSDLPLPELAPRQLGIRNRTSGEPARAIRTSSDGTFDAFAPLVPGENDLEISAVLADGRRVRERRRVLYAPPEVVTEEDRRRAARLLVELRWRTRDVQREQLGFPPR